MKRILRLEIKCDTDTCATADGLCPRMRTQRFGSRFVCALFDHKELRDHNGVLSGPGWLQRLPECVEAEEGGGSDSV